MIGLYDLLPLSRYNTAEIDSPCMSQSENEISTSFMHAPTRILESYKQSGAEKQDEEIYLTNLQLIVRSRLVITTLWASGSSVQLAGDGVGDA